MQAKLQSESSETGTQVDTIAANGDELKRPLKGPTRRNLLKSMTTTVAAVLSSSLVRPRGGVGRPFAESQPASDSWPPAKSPAWYGFNLLEYFTTDPALQGNRPHSNDGMFKEDDFRWMRDWGFTFVRLPMDYRFWTDPNDMMTINDKMVEPIDRAIRLGERYGIYINICLHRALGEWIQDGENDQVNGRHLMKEKTSVYDDPHTLAAFVHQWSYFAQRYRGIPSERLSFNLVNEPLVMLTAAERAELASHKSADGFIREMNERHERQYVRVARAAINAIRTVDPQRWIISDGYQIGVVAIPDLIGTGIMRSCHQYYPVQLTHYQAEWAGDMVPKDTPLPTWPLKDRDGHVFDRAALSARFRPWRDLTERGVRIHFGEMGCYQHTPPEVVLAWFNDSLDAIAELGSGWALWNLRGPFGILDSGRAWTKYEDWYGHQLDRPLLDLLQKKQKERKG
jgi:endoglucanase